MIPAVSSRRTRSRQGRGDSPTVSANFWIVERPLRCKTARILMSILSNEGGRFGGIIITHNLDWLAQVAHRPGRVDRTGGHCWRGVDRTVTCLADCEWKSKP